MATVKFSGELRDNIIRNAESLFTGKIEAAIKEFDNEWGDKVFERGFEPFMETINKLPMSWVILKPCLSLNLIQTPFGLTVNHMITTH